MSTNNSKIFSKSLFWMLMGLCLLSISVHAQENFEAKYQQLKASKSKVNFKNQLTEDQYNNILRYEYFYNGGGVAVGDLDNDGLDDKVINIKVYDSLSKLLS